jgi:hypothetical protein
MADDIAYIRLPELMARLREHIYWPHEVKVIGFDVQMRIMLQCNCGFAMTIIEPTQVIDRPDVNASGQRYMAPPPDTTWRPDGAIAQAFAEQMATVYRSCRRCKVVDSYTDTEPHVVCPRCGNADYLPTVKRDYSDDGLPMGVFDDVRHGRESAGDWDALNSEVTGPDSFGGEDTPASPALADDDTSHRFKC